MKKYSVYFVLTGTAEVMAKDEDDAMRKVQDMETSDIAKSVACLDLDRYPKETNKVSMGDV